MAYELTGRIKLIQDAKTFDISNRHFLQSTYADLLKKLSTACGYDFTDSRGKPRFGSTSFKNKSHLNM